MPMDAWLRGDLLIVLLFYLIFAASVGSLAAMKNRDRWKWGLIGGLFFLPSVLILAFLSPLCPRCHRPLSSEEHGRRSCASCEARERMEPDECKPREWTS
jgi:hypothetical protein